MLCKHDWKLISETTTKSKLEVAVDSFSMRAKFDLPWQLADATRRHIQVFSCAKCGKLKRFSEQV